MVPYFIDSNMPLSFITLNQRKRYACVDVNVHVESIEIHKTTHNCND